MWDWKELQADPIELVVAAPLEGNLHEWHVYLIGPADLAGATATHQYTGWSSAYTVRSILMQLQALLWHPDM
ncbi:hypothetical protein AMAG_18104 [Allomyces macrogynus ATCC 38327]|uniref:Uncharacterized protein n=1 Tax=Allomyces macrogynus (strain ATCC 38327) TaxID=578462 RepID=A0A0L0S9T0_ALLM3|nr:hypothetical protein AMAG_18104 [Allomyces macrogynus ATCC 38327]|eukprot:KNE59144.1 hypothetical protein AMAG_18104 [Allomyces macrogynus ATCC 38327]